MKIYFKTILIVLIVSFAAFSAGQSAHAEQLVADKCAQICVCEPTTPMPNGWDGHGSSVGWWEGCNPRTLLHWSIPDLPEGAQVAEAKIELYCLDSWGQVQGQLAFAPITDSWTPDTVTWNTRPGIDSSREITTEWPNVGQFLQLDITSLVRLWYEGTLPNNGIEAYAAASYWHGGIDFASPGYIKPYRPKLTILATPEPSSALLLGLAGIGLLRRSSGNRRPMVRV
jgi:hypothetical protein